MTVLGGGGGCYLGIEQESHIMCTPDQYLCYVECACSSISCFCFSIPCSYPRALALVASGAVNVKPLITHNFKLEQTLEAFETSRTGAGGAIKVMIHCDEGYQK